MNNLRKMKFEEVKDMLRFCFEESLTIPNISTADEWLTVFHAMIKAESWANEVKKEEEAKTKKKDSTVGCKNKKFALASAEMARGLREARYYKYLRDIVGGCEDVVITLSATENKVTPLTIEEYKMLNLGNKRDLTRKETDAIYYWKFIKDGQFESKKLRDAEEYLTKIGLLTIKNETV